MSGDVRRGVVHRPPDLPVYQHTPPPSPSAWMGICLMFPSPLLLGLLASQTVSDTAVFQTHCHCFCFIFFPCKMPSWKILSKQMWICNCDGLFLPYLSTFLYFPSIMCPVLLMLFLTLSVCLSHPYFFTPHLWSFHHPSLLVSVLNQLPLPSPLPATTTKSLLYNGRIAEEVTCLLGCRDENLASQLAHGLNQVSTEHM